MRSSKRGVRSWAFGVVLLSCCAAACGPGATSTSDAGSDTGRTEGGIDGAALTDAPAVMDAPAETGPTQCPDLDDDGHGAAPCGDDCDDTDRRRYPGAREVCDGEGRDEDCNPCTVGEVLPAGVGGDADQDEDGYPSNACFNVITGEAMPVCNAGTGADGGTEPAARVAVNAAMRETRGTDCSDRTRTRNPAASERCDTEIVDENCNGEFNEGCECPTRERPEVSRRCADATGAPAPGVCGAGTQDCLDGRWGACSVAPSTETCNDRDDDCDGLIDEGPDGIERSLQQSCYPDADGDNFGDSMATPTRACACPTGTVNSGTDCNDVRGVGTPINPSADEVCDGAMADENCDGVRNPGCACSLTGADLSCCGGRGTQRCAAVPGGGTMLTMCNAPVAPEVCDGVDNDCDGLVDETQDAAGENTGGNDSLKITCYLDGDGDGYAPAVADSNAAMQARVCPLAAVPMRGRCGAGYTDRRPVAGSADCLDAAVNANPGRSETVCDGLDNDCNASTRDDVAATSQSCFPRDPRFPTAMVTGRCRMGTLQCSPGMTGATQCGGAYVAPTTETCDGVDEDCDGVVDDGAATSCVPATVSGATVVCRMPPATGCTFNCNAGRGNCDGNAANGCERDLNTDNTNCGACGVICPSGNACTAGRCVASCPAGEVRCTPGGSCTDTSFDPRNCGRCGRSCVNPRPFCDDGRCCNSDGSSCLN